MAPHRAVSIGAGHLTTTYFWTTPAFLNGRCAQNSVVRRAAIVRTRGMSPQRLCCAAFAWCSAFATVGIAQPLINAHTDDEKIDPRWKLIAEDSVTQEQAFVSDIRVWESFSSKPKATEGWLMVIHRVPKPMPSGVGAFRAEQAKITVECDTNRVLTSHRIWYQDATGRGKRTSAKITPAQVTEAPPGSKTRQIVDKLCDYNALTQLQTK
jgi:hypothetical protein